MRKKEIENLVISLTSLSYVGVLNQLWYPVNLTLVLQIEAETEEDVLIGADEERKQIYCKL